jgi:hypothetical protein
MQSGTSLKAAPQRSVAGVLRGSPRRHGSQPMPVARLQRRRPIMAAAPGSRPGPEYAALEAAVGAINKVLSVNSKLRGSSAAKDGSARQRVQDARADAAAAAAADPGKLVTFKARASGSKDVTVRPGASGWVWEMQ